MVCHSLRQWTMVCQKFPPWPVNLGWPYIAWLIVSLSWTRLWSTWSVWLVFCDCCFHSVYPLMNKDKRLMEASWCERLIVMETALLLMGGILLSKSLIQFSVDGWGYVTSLFGLRPILLAYTKTVGLRLQDIQGKSGLVSCGDTAPFSWLLVHTRFCLCPPGVCFPSPVEVL